MTAPTTTNTQQKGNTMNNGVNQRTCPQCDHEAYDVACDEYAAQPCCGYVEHVDDMTGPDSHYDECVNAPAWMKE